MPELADILRDAAPEYLAKYGDRMLPSHKRAICDIILCRTRPLGGNVYRCEPCDEYQYSYHSCKNRSCPKCGNDDATRWLTAQSALLLPVQYFIATSTLPRELRRVARSNQKLIYGLLLRCTAETIQKLARDSKWVGGEIGLLAVLQTWRRDMNYHVHAHFIVPGGGLSPDGKKWLPAQRDFLMPNKAVAKILRGKPVRSRAFDRFRIAISNKRIVRFKDGKVTFRYQDNKGKWHKETLVAEQFMSRFLQHVLPLRFVKVRCYGFLSPGKRKLLEAIKELFGLFKSQEETSGSGCDVAAEVPVMRCPNCGSEMRFVKELKPVRSRAFDWPERWRAPPWLFA